MSKSTEYKNKYISENYDRINLTLPKGLKEEVMRRAEELSLSTNGYIQALIQKDLAIPFTAERSVSEDRKDMDVFLL